MMALETALAAVSELRAAAQAQESSPELSQLFARDTVDHWRFFEVRCYACLRLTHVLVV